MPKSNSLAEFNAVCRQLCSRENVTFVIEEAERYLGQGKELGDDAFELINRGRNWGIGIVAVTRRIQRLSKDFFDLCQHVVFFKCGLKSRLYIEDMIGKETEHVLHLKRFRFFYYNVDTEETEIRWLNLEGVRPHLEADKALPAEPVPTRITPQKREQPRVEVESVGRKPQEGLKTRGSPIISRE